MREVVREEHGGLQAVHRRLSLTRPKDVVARCTRAAISPSSIAARTKDSFSFSAGERLITGVGWREGRLPELELTERDMEREEVREAMAVPASRAAEFPPPRGKNERRRDDVAKMCLVRAEERRR